MVYEHFFLMFFRSSPEVYDSADDHRDWHQHSYCGVAVWGWSFWRQLCGRTVHQLPELGWVCCFLRSAQLLSLHHGVCLLSFHKRIVRWVSTLLLFAYCPSTNAFCSASIFLQWYLPTLPSWTHCEVGEGVYSFPTNTWYGEWRCVQLPFLHSGACLLSLLEHIVK